MALNAAPRRGGTRLAEVCDLRAAGACVHARDHEPNANSLEWRWPIYETRTRREQVRLWVWSGDPEHAARERLPCRSRARRGPALLENNRVGGPSHADDIDAARRRRLSYPRRAAMPRLVLLVLAAGSRAARRVLVPCRGDLHNLFRPRCQLRSLFQCRVFAAASVFRARRAQALSIMLRACARSCFSARRLPNARVSSAR